MPSIILSNNKNRSVIKYMCKMKEIDKNSTTIVKNSVQSIKSTSIIDACIMYSEMQSTLLHSISTVQGYVLW